ncbi:MAG TPA: ferritin-like domain-containing protein [Saprospiraceae bacterium]|nr:ferritin-like domain-containing protein [Saprospiraceae bacterium]HPI05034.1 ferritin-like domain-containing protein [Saprospiraceae bacterium]
MKVSEIISAIGEQDPEIYERLSSRRRAMSGFVGFGKKLALTSVPFFLGSVLQKAYGQSTGTLVVDTLNFALTLEYLEYRFYNTALGSSGLIPSGPANAAITTIRDHELAHVNFLKTAITAAGGTPVSEPTFDLTGGNGSGNGPFKDAFSNYQVFLAVAQTLEDTGVRAYKGQAGNLISNDTVLTAALNIHSVEARHASHIRQMRKANGFDANIKPWITGKDTEGVAGVDASYAGEENTTQADVSIINIGGQTISASAASEAFDEPLTKEQILLIVDPFLA